MPIINRKRFRHKQLQRTTSCVFANRGNIITLIQFYRGNECLWNPRNEDYNDAIKKRMIWNWIAKQFGATVTTQKVQNLIRILQEQAMLERKAEKEAVVLRIDFVPEFDYYEEFDFLKSLEEFEAEKLSENDVNDVTIATTSNKNSEMQSQADTFCDGIRNILRSLPLHVFAKTQTEILKILQNVRAEH